MNTSLRLSIRVLPLLAVLAVGCSDQPLAPPEAAPPGVEPVAAFVGRGCHATGEVELVWKGNAGATAGGDSVRIAAAVFDVHEADGARPAHGTFVYSVRGGDGTVHREVTAAVTGVAIDPATRKVWYVGEVVADTKGCAGGPGGGHDPGCAGDDGGCSDGHDDGHDGGCDGDHDDGGCTDGGHDDGGCPDGSHDDGGCPDGSHPDGGAGGHRGASGRTCRVGQVIAGKAHDSGAPGAPCDGITWKWFLADDPDRPRSDDLAAWPHLCRKEITGGNLAIHVPGVGGGRVREQTR